MKPIIVETHVKYDIQYRKKGARQNKVESQTLYDPVQVQIPGYSSEELPVVVWASASERGADRWSRSKHLSTRNKFGLRRLGDDFLIPILSPVILDKAKSIDPAFVRSFGGRRMTDLKAQVDLATPETLSHVGLTLGDRGQAVKGRHFGYSGIARTYRDLKDIGDLKSSTFQTEALDLSEKIGDRFVVVDGVLHDRVGPNLARLSYGHVDLVDLTNTVTSADDLDNVAPFRLAWTSGLASILKKSLDRKLNDAEVEHLRDALWCEVVDEKACAVDEPRIVADHIVRSIVAGPDSDRDVFASSRPEFLRAWMDLRLSHEAGADPFDTLAAFASATGRIETSEANSWQDSVRRSRLERNGVTAAWDILDRNDVAPVDSPAPRITQTRGLMP